MAGKQPKLVVQAAPFVKRGVTTPRLMLDVLIAVAPVVLSALWYFGISALLVLLVSTVAAVLTEALFGERESLGDGSAALTGLLFGLTLPPAIPLWIALVGAVVAIGLGKRVWGGLGHNLFNPALVGRAFLQAAFPTVMTTWVPPSGPSAFFRLQGPTLARPLMRSDVDMITTASPLSRMKFEQQLAPWLALLWGNTAGSLGETHAALIIAAGIFLALRRAFDWRIPISIGLTVAAVTAVFHGFAPASYPPPWFMLLSGGLLFGAVYMATDPVTSPLAPRGAWIFGIGIGVLVVLIRLFGGLPEGVMYAILLMNAATPLIERVGQPRPFGRKSSR